VEEKKVIEFNFGKMTLLIILICAVFFMISSFFPGIIIYFAFSKKAEWYTIFTNAFFHSSIVHLGYNMLNLFIFGSIIEVKENSKFFLFVIFFGILFGNLGFSLFSNDYSIGLSGGIFGLIGCAMVLFPNQKVILPLFGIGVLSKIWFAGPVMACGELLLSFFAEDNIAHSAHFFGFLAGMVIGFARRNKRNMQNIERRQDSNISN